MIFLDTNIIVKILHRQGSYERYLQFLEDKHIGLTVITIFELVQGVEASKKKEQNMIALKGIANTFPIFHLTTNSAFIAAKINQKLIQTGHPIELNDIYIAAIVLENEGELLTENVDHFKHISTLKMITSL